MARLRGVGLLAVVGLVVGVSGCTSAAPASSAQAAELHRQAQEALTHWDAAVAASPGESGFILVGESTLFVGQDWGPNIDGNNAKMALYAGLFVAATPLPSEAPPDGTLRRTSSHLADTAAPQWDTSSASPSNVYAPVT